MDVSGLSFDFLGRAINRIKHSSPDRLIWKLIKENPLSANSIKQMVQRGVRVETGHSCAGVNGGPGIPETIVLSLMSENNPYERDKELFHELEHVHYGRELRDLLKRYEYGTTEDGARLNGLLTKDKADENRIITEWLARQDRAKPELLRAAIIYFKLTPHIYDSSSREAFGKKYNHEIDGQFLFQFMTNKRPSCKKRIAARLD